MNLFFVIVGSGLLMSAVSLVGGVGCCSNVKH